MIDMYVFLNYKTKKMQLKKVTCLSVSQRSVAGSISIFEGVWKMWILLTPSYHAIVGSGHPYPETSYTKTPASG